MFYSNAARVPPKASTVKLQAIICNRIPSLVVVAMCAGAELVIDQFVGLIALELEWSPILPEGVKPDEEGAMPVDAGAAPVERAGVTINEPVPMNEAAAPVDRGTKLVVVPSSYALVRDPPYNNAVVEVMFSKNISSLLELDGAPKLPLTQMELSFHAACAATRQISVMSLIISGVYHSRQSAASYTNWSGVSVVSFIRMLLLKFTPPLMVRFSA